MLFMNNDTRINTFLYHIFFENQTAKHICFIIEIRVLIFQVLNAVKPIKNIINEVTNMGYSLCLPQFYL